MKKIIAIVIVFLFAIALLATTSVRSAVAYSVCGDPTNAMDCYRTSSYYITVCAGEASAQMVMMFPDGTGYNRVPVISEGNGYSGSDSQHNYLINPSTFTIGTDGQPPVRQPVTQYTRLCQGLCY